MTATAPKPPSGARRDWTTASAYALGVLTIINTFNFLDRNLLALLLPLIKAEFKVSDTALGAVNSLFFVSAILGVPVAALADRWNRRNLIAISLVIWSLSTSLTGLADSIVALALFRLVMSAGEAGGVPSSNSMLADIFPKTSRPLALSIFTSGASISLILYAPVIGWVADHYGWRASFFIAGIPGILLALVFMLTVKEPPRGGAAAVAEGAKPAPPVPFWPSIRFLLKSKTYVLLVIGSAFMSCINYGAGAWTATFFVRVHDLSLTQVGAFIQPLRGFISLAGIVLAGLVVTKVAQKDERWRVWVPALTCLIYVPCEMVYLFADPLPMWLTGFIVSSVFSLMYQGAAYSAVMEVSAPGTRGVAMAVLLLIGTIFGQLVGSIGIGFLNDHLAPMFGQLAVRYSMGLVLVSCALLASFCYALSARYLPADARRAEALA